MSTDGFYRDHDDCETSEDSDNESPLTLSLSGFDRCNNDTMSLFDDREAPEIPGAAGVQSGKTWCPRKTDTGVLKWIVFDLVVQNSLIGLAYFFWPAWQTFLLRATFEPAFLGMVLLVLHLSLLLVWSSADIKPDCVGFKLGLFSISRMCLLTSMFFFVPRLTNCGMNLYLFDASSIIAGLISYIVLDCIMSRCVYKSSCGVWFCVTLSVVSTLTLSMVVVYAAYLQGVCTSSLSQSVYITGLIRHFVCFMVVPLTMPVKVQHQWAHVMGLQRIGLWLLFLQLF
jgi:hypothetical protein